MIRKITMIAAIAKNRAIGRAGGLLYRLPDDMRHFKEKTTGHTVIMGRKTFESFPKGALPNRRNIVISSNRSLRLDGAEVCGSFGEALTKADQLDCQVFIIGGGSVYEQGLRMAGELELTVVDDEPSDADTFFPEWRDDPEWQLKISTPHGMDARHLYPFKFETWTRIPVEKQQRQYESVTVDGKVWLKMK